MTDEPARHNAWWLSTRRRRAEWHSLTAAGVATFTGRPRAQLEAARPGDPVLVYLARPDHAIRAVGVVGEGSRVRDQGPEDNATKPDPRPLIPDPSVEVQLAFEVLNGPGWRAIAGEPSLAEAEPVRQRSSGTLFPLSSEEYERLRAMIEERNPELAAAFSSIEAGAIPESGAGSDNNVDSEAGNVGAVLREEQPPYVPLPLSVGLPGSGLPPVGSRATLQALTGLPTATLEEMRDLLEDSGQIVLSGPPGTGKTWLARGLAALVAGDPERVQVVQFHPSTAYEDFIEGLKPRVDDLGQVTYAVVPGIFVRLCEAARRDPDRYYVLVIDEINRAPLGRVFGELLYALEYRGPEGAVALSVSAGMGVEQRSELFYVPDNLLIVGTMNSADRSLALVDYALRRRFRFVELEPDAGVLDRWLMAHGSGAARRRIALDLFAEVNRRLAEMLDPDHRLGHSYFMLDPLDGPTLDRLWRTAVKPLLSEYFIPPSGEVEEFRALFAEAVAELGGMTTDDGR